MLDMSAAYPPLSPATALVALGRPDREPGAPVSPPLVLSSTFTAGGDLDYAREGNPTWEPFEEVLGTLEGGRALAFGSGMAAATAAFSLVAPGGVIVVPRVAYSGVLASVRQRVEEGQVIARAVDLTDTDAVVASLPGADLIWLESPTNPLLDVADLPAILAAARAQGVRSVVDNTFATPLRQRPLTLGADVVMHSVTKYLSGHSDLLLGALVTATDDEAVRAQLLTHRTLVGAIPGAFDTWLALRGIRTLAVRLDRAEASARELARRLAGLEGVQRVRYPGSGAMIAFELESATVAQGCVDACRLVSASTSLGGVESQIERRRRYAGESADVPESLLRLSVGIEEVEDLWRDLSQAVAAAVDTSR